MFGNIKTDPKLLKLLRDTKNHVMTPEEVQAQRESYARSMEPCEHGVRDWETCVGCRKNSVVKGN